MFKRLLKVVLDYHKREKLMESNPSRVFDANDLSFDEMVILMA